MTLPPPPVPPEEEIWSILRIAKRWGIDAVLAEAELQNAGFPSAEIPRKPAIGYRFSDVLAFEKRWREAEIARAKKREEDAKRHAEAQERTRKRKAEADTFVAKALEEEASAK
jgi:hypothetical protein